MSGVEFGIELVSCILGDLSVLSAVKYDDAVDGAITVPVTGDIDTPLRELGETVCVWVKFSASVNLEDFA